MAIYTKHGDLGETCLINRRGVVKDHLCLQAGGDIDELSAHLGMVLATLGDGEDLMLHGRIRCIQRELVQIGGLVAGGGKLGAELGGHPIKSGGLLEDAIMRLEGEIDEMAEDMPEISGFVLMGDDGIVAACLDVTRTVCRRAERNLVSMAREVDVDKNILAYINRLSDWLFVSARFMENKNAEKAE